MKVMVLKYLGARDLARCCAVLFRGCLIFKIVPEMHTSKVMVDNNMTVAV